MFTVGQTISPDEAMDLAIEMAKKGRGFVSPNPLVGCVIVDKNHEFLAAGAHRQYGGPHAEVDALSNVSDPKKLEGGSLYVTLEPCSHHGKTPPCCEAIANTKLLKVIYGTKDPNPLVAGKGLDFLKAHSFLTQHFEKYEGLCREVSEQFFYHITHQLPFVSLKVGASLDGKIALSNGQSQWITGEESRQLGRQLRGHYDATMIGAGTLLKDNPTLDFRDTPFEGKKDNKIILLDPKGKGVENFKETTVYKKHGAKNIFVLTRDEYISTWSKNLVHVVPWEATKEGWQNSLKNLYQKGIYSIYVEGGAYVFGQMLSYELAQKLYLFQSSKILGEGMSWSQYMVKGSLAEVPELKSWTSLSVGQDRLHAGYF